MRQQRWFLLVLLCKNFWKMKSCNIAEVRKETKNLWKSWKFRGKTPLHSYSLMLKASNSLLHTAQGGHVSSCAMAAVFAWGIYSETQIKAFTGWMEGWHWQNGVLASSHDITRSFMREKAPVDDSRSAAQTCWIERVIQSLFCPTMLHPFWLVRLIMPCLGDNCTCNHGVDALTPWRNYGNIWKHSPTNFSFSTTQTHNKTCVIPIDFIPTCFSKHQMTILPCKSDQEFHATNSVLKRH